MYKTLIDAQTLFRHLSGPDWLCVDCRYDLADKDAGYQSYLSGHIPGAVYADLHRDLSGKPATDCGRHPVPSPGELGAKFTTLGIAAHKQVVAYDNSGGSFAARLWWMLNYAGHDRVAVLDGGLHAWNQEGYRLEAGENRAEAGSFRAAPNTGALVRLNEVETVARLVDSREPDRYAGKVEPVDAVAGHIPGALNHHWKNNLDEHGRFLPPERLRRGFQELYAGVRADEIVFYCGSGVSACHNLLAAVHAGYPLPRLYAGSWSEWSSDPSRPVAVGSEGLPGPGDHVASGE